MGKTIISRTLVMSSTIIRSLVFMHGHHVYVYMYKRIQELKILCSVCAQRIYSLVWLDPFLAQGVYCLQYKHLAKALSMGIMLCSYLYVLNYLAGPQLHIVNVSFSYVAITFTLNF